MADFLFLAEAAHGAAEHGEAAVLWLTPGFWVALAMITLIVIMLWMRVPAMIGGMLDKKIEGIRTMLDEAAQLRREAEALKAEYEKKVASADAHAAELKAAAEEEAKAIVARAKQDATSLIARREKMAEDKIAAAERAAVEELRAKAADAAAAAARGLIAKKHDEAADSKLIDSTISTI